MADIDRIHSSSSSSSKRTQLQSSIVKVLLLFLCALGLVIAVYYAVLPPLGADDLAQLRLPRNMGDVKQLTGVLSRYTEDYYWRVVFSIWTLYMFLQCFSVPGTILLNVLCGCLFAFPVAFSMTLAAGTIGASLAFALSHLIGRPIVEHFTDKLSFMQEQVEKQRENIVFFMLFLRVSPLLPNWFVNLSSPIVGIPFAVFFFTTLVGIAPQTFIAVNTGASLVDIAGAIGGEGLDDSMVNPLLNVRTIGTLFGIALLALLPVLVKAMLKGDVSSTATTSSLARHEAREEEESKKMR